MKLSRVVFYTDLPTSDGQMVRSFILDSRTKTLERVREQDGAMALVVNGGLRYNWQAVAAYVPVDEPQPQAKK